MIFANRLSAVIVFYAVFSMTLILTGGLYSFKQLAAHEQEYKVSEVVKLIDYELLELSGSRYMAFWVPHWLKANDVIRLELRKKDGIVFTYQDELHKGTQLPQLKIYNFTLQRHSHLQLSIWMKQPGHRLHLSLINLDAIIIFLASLSLVILSLLLTIIWIKKSLLGAKALEVRAINILANNKQNQKPHNKDIAEWPKSAGKALNHLLEQLQDARQDRSRFDSFIRKNAFIDPLTGLGNKLQLRNQLSSELDEKNDTIGVLLLIDLPLISSVNEQEGEDEGDHLLILTRDTLRSYKERFTAPLLTRYSGKSFALLLPLISSSEGESAAKAIMKLLYRIALPSGYHREQFYYIGVTVFKGNEPTFQVLEELEMSLRIAKLQGSSNWHMEDKEVRTSLTDKGTVRWRSMLDNIIENQKMAFYSQDIHNSDDQPFANLIFCKVIDENNKHIPPSIYLPMAHKTGSIAALENLFWHRFSVFKSQLKITSTISFIELHAKTLLQHKFQRWVKVALLEQPIAVRRNIVIQFSENQLEEPNSLIWKNLKELKELGCKLCICNAGQAVMSTSYIQALEVDYLMLHRGLIHRIARNPMNQVAIRSLIASCGELKVQVLAQGVSSKKEWSQLKQLGVKGGTGPLLTKESLHDISSK